MKKILTLTKEEKEILAEAENGNFTPVSLKSKTIEHYAKIAKYTTAKNKTISIRISAVDLMKLKAKAVQEGVPYQTLITSYLHKITLE